LADLGCNLLRNCALALVKELSWVPWARLGPISWLEPC